MKPDVNLCEILGVEEEEVFKFEGLVGEYCIMANRIMYKDDFLGIFTPSTIPLNTFLSTTIRPDYNWTKLDKAQANALKTLWPEGVYVWRSHEGKLYLCNQEKIALWGTFNDHILSSVKKDSPYINLDSITGRNTVND